MIDWIKKQILKLKENLKNPVFWARLVSLGLLAFVFVLFDRVVEQEQIAYNQQKMKTAQTLVAKKPGQVGDVSSPKEIVDFSQIVPDKVNSIEVYSFPYYKNLVVHFKDGTNGLMKQVDNETYSAFANKLVGFGVKLKFEEGSVYVKNQSAITKAPPESIFSILIEIVAVILKFIFSNIFMILILGLTFFMIKATMVVNKSSFNILMPEDIKGTMDDLIGMADIKKEVRSLMAVVRNKEAYRKYGVDRPFNIMFTGPAGVGKTKIAGYFAKELGVPVISAEGSSLETGYVGGGAKTLQKIHQEAIKLKKCVVFLDEAQSLFIKRGSSSLPGSGSKFVDDTANTFLSILDGIKSHKDAEIIWIVASNFDDATMEMDEAMLRRFQLKVNFRLPNKQERQDIIKSLLTNKETGELIDLVKKDVNLSELAEITAELSPAMLETIIAQAKILAVEESVIIDEAVLFKSFERTTIGLTDRQTTAEMKKTREIIATHELGHFVGQLEVAMSEANGNLETAFDNISTLKISTESVSKMNALGYVLSKKDDAKLSTRKELEERILSLYGGVAAEEVFYGAEHISVGSHNDIQKVTDLLNLMVVQLSMYSESKINYGQLSKDLINKQDIMAQIESLSRSLYEKSKEIIVKNKAAIEYLKPILMDQYVISKEEVYVHLKKFRENQNI